MAEPYNPLLTRKKLCAGQEETTSGSTNYGTTAIAGDIFDVRCQPRDVVADGNRRPQGNYLGNYRAVPGRKTGTLSYRQRIHHGSDFLAMLTGAGFLNSAGTRAPTSSMASRKTWSWQVYEDGRRKRLYGAVANLQLEFVRGAPAVAIWDWEGVWEDPPADASMITQPTLTTLPYACTSMTVTYDANVTAHMNSIRFNMGNTIVERENVLSSAGVSHFVITERDPTWSIDHEARLTATGELAGPDSPWGDSQKSSYALLTAGTENALVVTLSNGSNTMVFTCSKVQRRQVSDEDRGGKLLDAIELQCNTTSGDDEIQITVT